MPILCAAVGVALYGGLRATGAFGEFGGSSSGSAGAEGSRSGAYRSSAPSSLRERIQEAPSGWLIAVTALCGVWILGWLVVLLVGLNLLT